MMVSMDSALIPTPFKFPRTIRKHVAMVTESIARSLMETHTHTHTIKVSVSVRHSYIHAVASTMRVLVVFLKTIQSIQNNDSGCDRSFAAVHDVCVCVCKKTRVPRNTFLTRIKVRRLISMLAVDAKVLCRIPCATRRDYSH